MEGMHLSASAATRRIVNDILQLMRQIRQCQNGNKARWTPHLSDIGSTPECDLIQE
jgi:hypothetical protein